MAWFFKCVTSSSSGPFMQLIVTCASDFAGLTITCTDGTTTLTKQCPNSSPYEVAFDLPNVGTWTISGTIGVDVYSEDILVEEFNAELVSEANIEVDVYSAANDTISYVGLDSQTHTITTDSSGHASATIRVRSNGSTFTFTSTVAKSTTDVTVSYSKTITLDYNTTEINIMPDGTLCWYGYYKIPVKGYALKNSGAVSYAGTVAPTITKDTNTFTGTISGSSKLRYGTVAFDEVIDLSQYNTCKIFVKTATARADGSGYASTICLVSTLSVPLVNYYTTPTYWDIVDAGGSSTKTITNTIGTMKISSVNDNGYIVIHLHTASKASSFTVYSCWLE